MFSACCENEVRASVAPAYKVRSQWGMRRLFVSLIVAAGARPTIPVAAERRRKFCFISARSTRRSLPRASARRSHCSTTCGSTSISPTTVFREGFAIALVGLGAFLLKLGHRLWHDPYFHLIVLAAVFMAARTLAFPGEAYRALPASYLMLAPSGSGVVLASILVLIGLRLITS